MLFSPWQAQRRGNGACPHAAEQADQELDRRAGVRRLKRGVVGRHKHGLRVAHGIFERLGKRTRVRVADVNLGKLALQQPYELWRERVALVIGIALEAQAEHGDSAASE